MYIQRTHAIKRLSHLLGAQDKMTTAELAISLRALADLMENESFRSVELSPTRKALYQKAIVSHQQVREIL